MQKGRAELFCSLTLVVCVFLQVFCRGEGRERVGPVVQEVDKSLPTG